MRPALKRSNKPSQASTEPTITIEKKRTSPVPSAVGADIIIYLLVYDDQYLRDGNV